MTRPSERSDPWRPFKPRDDARWDLARVVHLHRRAGFGATWSEIRRDLADGPDASVGRVLEGRSRTDGRPKRADTLAERLTSAALEQSDIGRLQAAWVYRMLFGSDPLTERLTLMWHDHFATGFQKVRSVHAMAAQNALLRRFARVPFRELLSAMMRDYALLVWLDAPANRKAHPNENLARELMELFTLGVGHYSEKDVKEAARALTGWTVDRTGFKEMPVRHDDGEKTILGTTGKFRAPDLVDLLLDHPATSRRLAERLCGVFMGEGAADDAAKDALAARLRKSGLDVGAAVETVLRSELFFNEANIGTRVTDPTLHVVGICRALELFDPPPRTLFLARWMARIGQELFNPPNVGGWPKGRAWLSGRTLVARTNFALAAVQGDGVGRKAAVDPVALAKRHGVKDDDLASLAAHAAALLHGRSLARDTVKRLVTRAEGADHPARHLLASMLTLPRTHLG